MYVCVYSLNYTLSLLSCSVVCFCEWSFWCRWIITCFNCSLSVLRLVRASATVELHNAKASRFEAHHQTHHVVFKVFTVRLSRKWYLGGSCTELCMAPLCSTKRCRCWHSAPSSWAQCPSCCSSSAVIWLQLLSFSFSITRSVSASFSASWTACSSRSAALRLSCDHTPQRISFSTTLRLFMCLQMIAFCGFLAPVPSVSAASAAQPGAPLSVIYK